MFLRKLLIFAVFSAVGATFADAPPEVASPPARRPEIGDAGKAAVMAFRLKNYVGLDLVIGDGYVDGGHGMTIHLGGKVTSSREILTVDRKRDAELQKHLAYARSDELKKLSDLDRATRLARYVAALFTPKEGRKDLVEKTKILDTTYRNQEVLIGDVAKITKGAGVCRHRSLMYKLLADEAGLKVSLVRGLYGRDPAKAVYHAWNELFLDGGKMVIVDTTNPQPDFHFPTLDSKQAPRYLTPARQPKYQPEAKTPQPSSK
jgi:hypothetical protein